MSAFPVRKSDVAAESAAPSSLSVSILKLGRIAATAIERYPNEACGVLIGRNEGARTFVAHFVETGNLNTERADHYSIDPDDQLRAEQWARDRGLEVVGVWHSRPDNAPLPSEADRSLTRPGYSHLIVAVDERRRIALRSWQLDGEDFKEEIIES